MVSTVLKNISQINSSAKAIKANAAHAPSENISQIGSSSPIFGVKIKIFELPPPRKKTSSKTCPLSFFRWTKITGILSTQIETLRFFITQMCWSKPERFLRMLVGGRWFIPLFTEFLYIPQDGPLPVTNGVITPINGLIINGKLFL